MFSKPNFVSITQTSNLKPSSISNDIQIELTDEKQSKQEKLKSPNNQTQAQYEEQILKTQTSPSNHLLIGLISILASTIITFYWLLFATSLIWLVFKQPLSQAQFWLSLVLTFVFETILVKYIVQKTHCKKQSTQIHSQSDPTVQNFKNKPFKRETKNLNQNSKFKIWFKKSLIMMSIFVGILVICLSFARSFVDLSYDGQTYHQSGIIALDQGWNPLYENIFEQKDLNIQNKIWVSSYPHAANYQALSVYKITQNLEDGKLFNLLLVVACWLFSFLALRSLRLDSIRHKFISIVISVLIAINPVNLMQIFTFGLDSQFYCLLVCWIACLVMIHAKFWIKLNYWNLFAITVLMVNNKLTSIAYLIFFATAYLVIVLTLKFRRNITQNLPTYRSNSDTQTPLNLNLSVDQNTPKKQIIKSKWTNSNFKTPIFVFVSITIATLVFGYQPFVTNWKMHDNPMFPIFSPKQNDLKYDFGENRPSNWKEAETLPLFAASIFFASNGQFRAPQDEANFKIPFTYSQDEINEFIYLGPKTGGFGFLFSAIFIVAFVMLIVYLTKPKSKYKFLLVLILVLLLLSCLINPLSSNARYIPQLWLLPIIILIFTNLNGSKTGNIISVFLVYLISINSIVIFRHDLNFNLNSTNQINLTLKKLKLEANEKPLDINVGTFDGNNYLLKDNNIQTKVSYQKIEQFECEAGFIKTKLLVDSTNPSKYCKPTK